MILPGILSSQISGHLFTLTGSYDALATVTVPSGGASSITFSAIPQTGYKHLQIRSIAMVNNGSTASGNIRAQFNSDTGSNYSLHRLFGNGSTASADGYANQSSTIVGITTGSSSTNIFGGSVCDILDYSNTNKNKTTRTLDGMDINGSGGYVFLVSSLWQSTASINSITIFGDSGNFTQYSQFSLYGVK